ncbi:MAG: hypothetical protein HY205_04955 [Nitrospirae bacterium]|nr:hypothetical protein [Nitrospirota bacterium]
MWKSLSSLALACWLGAVAAQASEPRPAAPAQADSQRTTITAEKMTVRNQDSKAIFEGAVVLTKGALIVHSDVMVVVFKAGDQPAPGGGGAARGSGKARNAATDKSVPANAAGLPTTGNRSVSMIEATGRVRIEKDDGQATGQKAMYFAEEEKIILTGEPVAWQKGTRVTGQKITMYLAEGRSIVEGNSRVQIEEEQGGGR